MGWADVRVAGIDYSSRFVDLVTVPYEGAGSPVWHRFPLTGADAFDRARSVADALPGRASVLWDDVLAVGIEHPGGKHGTGALLRVQGAILARIPARMLVHPLPPGKWRTLAGLAGNATKQHVEWRSRALADPYQQHRCIIVVADSELTHAGIPQDAHDAHLIALATRTLIDTEQAA